MFDKSEWDLNDTVLEEYIERFYGHGSYRAKYWFVGMEFGGGGSAGEIVSRIQGWHDRGGKELEDLAGPNGIAQGSRWFRGLNPLQPTWSKLIRVLLGAESVGPAGHSPTTEEIRAYQKERLGREGGLDCIIELLPLPSPGLGRWLYYPEYSRLPYLRDRAAYTEHVAPARAAHLRQKIADYRPPIVVFYGAGYRHWWRAVAGAEFGPSRIDKALIVRGGSTFYVLMQHPAARGLPDSYFDAVGKMIRSAVGG